MFEDCALEDADTLIGLNSPLAPVTTLPLGGPITALTATSAGDLIVATATRR